MLNDNAIEHRLKILILHCCIFGLLFCYVIGSNGLCLIKVVCHIPCAGCGLTRAVKSFFAGNIMQAFAYHPLFWLAPIMIFSAVHVPIFFRNYNKKVYVAALIAMGLAFMICYIIRLAMYGINFI